jgi:hypothetical protein
MVQCNKKIAVLRQFAEKTGEVRRDYENAATAGRLHQLLNFTPPHQMLIPPPLNCARC